MVRVEMVVGRSEVVDGDVKGLLEVEVEVGVFEASFPKLQI